MPGREKRREVLRSKQSLGGGSDFAVPPLRHRIRRLLTLDKARVLAEVARHMEHLARRVPEARIQVYEP